MYEVTIDNFEGPLDLLLHLIKEAKMDIFDIKLEIIINDYLNYIKKMQELDLDIASSYLIMSCELLEIKSRMLLPKEELDLVEDDPKERLINRLIEYQKYKNQIDTFKDLEKERNTYFTKLPSNMDEYKKEVIITQKMNVDDLVKVFEDFLNRIKEDKPVNTKVTKKELSVEDKMVEIKNKLIKDVKFNFISILTNKTKPELIVTFLAVLELVKSGHLLIYQDNNFDEIICEGSDICE